MYVYYNANPLGKHTNDCTVRGISLLMDIDWDTAYLKLVMEGFLLRNMPDNNITWGSFLRKQGYKRYSIPNSCPDCYTTVDFCREHPRGRYLIATGSHVICVIDGDYYDISDTGDEVIAYYWTKEEMR